MYNRRKAIIALMFLIVLAPAAVGQVRGLGEVFAAGKTLLDLDGDGLPEKPAVTIIIPDRPTADELALAADIAARFNFESLAVSFDLVRRESEAGDITALPFPILIGDNLKWTREALKQRTVPGGPLAANQGLVFMFSLKGRRGVACIGGSDEALLRTGRAFFLRWPYLWEVWGRDTGDTFLSVENDLARLFTEDGLRLEDPAVSQALYEFQVAPPFAAGLQAFKAGQGEIRSMLVEVSFKEAGEAEKARKSLTRLRELHRRGERTDLLNYASCGRLDLELRDGATRSVLELPRVGAPRRLLTAAYKESPAREPDGKDFDLTSVDSLKGFYSDADKDGLADRVDSVIIVPAAGAPRAAVDLASRLTLSTAGAAFPLVFLDSEIERRKPLASPILVGDNALTRDLIKTGKLKIPALEAGWGFVGVVPKAFGKSNALVITGADGAGLESGLGYVARTFPYFREYGEGGPSLKQAAAQFETFLRGERGAAEAYFINGLERAAAGLADVEVTRVEARAVLPLPNPAFKRELEDRLKQRFPAAAVETEVRDMRSGKLVFEKEREFPWEADETLALLEEKLPQLGPPASVGKIRVSLGLSEPPEARRKLKAEVESRLGRAGYREAEVEVVSAYKQGFFWLTEKVLPLLKGLPVGSVSIRFAGSGADLGRMRRSSPDPSRWLAELYPVDEILSRELGLPVERVEFESKEPGGQTYEVLALDGKGRTLLEASFTPRTKKAPLAAALPEWGEVEAATGWLRIEAGDRPPIEALIATDLEKVWLFYQAEALNEVLTHIMKKTGDEPTFSKQPYFKRLKVELWASEPDYKLGLDEEIISSLESIHDEIYFDTLDLLRGITRFDPEDRELPEDTSRLSAPGNVLPVVHPLPEGGRPRVRVTLEDWPAATPELWLKWKTGSGRESSRKLVFPTLKPKSLSAPSLIYNGPARRVEELSLEADWEKETDYLAAVEILDSFRQASARGVLPGLFTAPDLKQVRIQLRHQAREVEFSLPANPPPPPAVRAAGRAPAGGTEPIVPTREIISPAACLELTEKLAGLPNIRRYIAGRSYEGRDIPVLELYLPAGPYVSIPRLSVLKPTLQLTARQHANEVSSTNYSLLLAELLARDPAYREALKKVNVAIQPMENPDGAQLAFELHASEPFHCLHAGRYSPLGVDIGTGTGAANPLIPEAAVRAGLYDRWRPDIFLNLHGYPSHEWVQQFSGYTPYLFRDYWIPKGWFTYTRALSLPVYDAHRAAADELVGFMIREFQADERLRESNRAFYARYLRWASRWSPQVSPLELHDGLNVFLKRRGPAENLMTPRAQTTFLEQTPELMDETAVGDWLDFLCRQGLAFLRAHLKYLTQARFERARVEEEVRDRVVITLMRARPAASGKDG
jgi:hypothetical protein